MIVQAKIIKELEYDLFNLALRNDKVARLLIKTNENFGTDHLKDVTRALEKITGREKNVLLVIASEYNLPAAQIRAHMASKACYPYTAAEAYVVKSFSQKLVANMYLNFNKPARPTRIFTTEEPAIDWLKTYL